MRKLTRYLKEEDGFTLAEVLITLGIIGVIAALTIPGLLNKYKAIRLRSQFLKSYSTVQQAFKQMEADDVSLNPDDYAPSQFVNTFANYLTGATLCKTRQHSINCFDPYVDDPNIYKGIHTGYLDDGSLFLRDGTLYMFENTAKVANPLIYVTVDLNGVNSPPNIAGYDTFTFQFNDGILKTMGDTDTEFSSDRYCDIAKAKTGLTNNNYGIACAQKAKTNPDYFKELIRKYK